MSCVIGLLSKRGLLALAVAAGLALGAGVSGAWAARPGVHASKSSRGSRSVSPEALTFKSHLEEMLSQRITTELATRIERDAFTVSSLVTLQERDTVVNAPVERPIEGSDEDPLELALGDVNVESLMAPKGGTSLRKRVSTGYVIDSVYVSVGLREGISKELQVETENWLKERLIREFGQIGNGTVTIMMKKPAAIDAAQEAARSWMGKLKDLQILAGLSIIAFAFLGAVLLWKKVAPPLSHAPAPQPFAPPAPIAMPSPPQPATEAKQAAPTEDGEGIDESFGFAIGPAGDKIRRMARSLGDSLDAFLAVWCQAGEEGLTKLVCFLDAIAGDEIRYNIPADAVEHLGSIFEKVSKMTAPEKKSLLQKAYWDMMAYQSMGTDGLLKPFNYLSQMRQESLKMLLMEQNPRMKAVVALSLPPSTREQYVQGLDANERRDLIQTALHVDRVPLEEVRNLDEELRASARAGGPETKSVEIKSMVDQLLDALSPEEEIELLAEVQKSEPASVESIKRAHPSLAFLPEWPEAELRLLLQYATAEEVLGFLQIRPELETCWIGLCPPLTAEMVRDERSGGRELSAERRTEALQQLKKRMEQLVESGAVDLKRIFQEEKNDSKASQVAAA